MEEKEIKKAGRSKKEENEEPKEVLYNINQACILFKISGRNRNVAIIKFKGQKHNEKGWKALFKNNKIIGK